jgi:bacterioferritin-associated ferredoxin
MYVCLCNAVTESTIRELVEDGYATLNEIEAVTGCSGACGTCRDHAERIISEVLDGPRIPVVATGLSKRIPQLV